VSVHARTRILEPLKLAVCFDESYGGVLEAKTDTSHQPTRSPAPDEKARTGEPPSSAP
jgi:hypothetical protein